MKFTISVDGAERTLEADRIAGENGAGSQMRVVLDGRSLDLDVVETAPGAISLLIGAAAYEASVALDGKFLVVNCGGREFRVQLRDPRAWRRAGPGVLEVEGRQQ